MSEWVWIDEALVLAVHEQLLVRHGGASGVRDLALLQSALAWPQQLAAYGDDADVIALAATLTAGIVKNHPFIDGNKRTGFVAGVLPGTQRSAVHRQRGSSNPGRAGAGIRRIERGSF